MFADAVKYLLFSRSCSDMAVRQMLGPQPECLRRTNLRSGVIGERGLPQLDHAALEGLALDHAALQIVDRELPGHRLGQLRCKPPSHACAPNSEL